MICLLYTSFSNPNKLLAFAGLDPSVYQSGNFQAKTTRMSKRCLLYTSKLNKENRAGNIQALKNDLKLADRALRNEKEKLRSANVMIGEYQMCIRDSGYIAKGSQIIPTTNLFVCLNSIRSYHTL